jgi:hypothetical protein
MPNYRLKVLASHRYLHILFTVFSQGTDRHRNFLYTFNRCVVIGNVELWGFWPSPFPPKTRSRRLKNLSRSLLYKGVGGEQSTAPPPPPHHHLISQMICGCSFKDNIKVILLLGVSFLNKSSLPCYIEIYEGRTP